MLGKEPFGEDIMTIIMGIDPCEPGMHGKLEEPKPSDDAIGLVMKIRDMCDEWLRSSGKEEGQSDTPHSKTETSDDIEESSDDEE